MQTTSIKLYSLGYNEAKTYLVAALFVLGNIALPQLCHLVPRGGMIWLPIYFFSSEHTNTDGGQDSSRPSFRPWLTICFSACLQRPC